ncbi:hypothetical protein DFJ74DRAFT_601286, partial [Hyaloraphidium curvatum]
VCAFATRPNDFAAAEAFAAAEPAVVVPGFAVHPWFAEAVGTDALSEGATRDNVKDALRRTDWGRDLLDGHLLPAIASGRRVVLAEFGLDRVATKPGTKELYSFEAQLRIFRAQLALGAALDLPASVHIVRAHGHAFDVLKGTDPADLPPRIMLHSFSGKPEVLAQLLNKLPKETASRLYFSFSPLNLRHGAPACLSGVPQDRILLESDVHHPAEVDAAMWTVCGAVAGALGWTREECAKRTGQNARAFLGM